jgi:hypothetical protein
LEKRSLMASMSKTMLHWTLGSGIITFYSMSMKRCELIIGTQNLGGQNILFGKVEAPFRPWGMLRSTDVAIATDL